MKTRKYYYILGIFLIFIPFICSAAKNKTQTIQCYIRSYGNEPFTYPGIVTENNEIYLVVASDKIQKQLLEMQGIKIEVTGYIIEENKELYEGLDNGSFKVQKWKKLKNKLY